MATNGKPPVRYEDAAEMRTGIIGWVCATCMLFWGRNEHMARWCCATDLPCECGGRNTDKHYTCCRACRDRKAAERWAALPREEWDGETPLVEWDGDRFLWDEDAVAEYVADHIEAGGAVEGIRLVLAEQEEPRSFSMADFQQDHIPPDGDGGDDFEEIDRIVNDWIEKYRPWCWTATGTAVAVESLRPFADQYRAEMEGA